MTIRRPALLIAYGPEARAFLQSGLHANFIANGMEPVIFASQPDSEVFASLPPGSVRGFPNAPEASVVCRLRTLSRRANGRGVCGAVERFLGRFLGGTVAWREALSQAGADAVVCTSFDSARTLPPLQTATNMGLRSFVFENSWKDSLTRPYAPTSPTAIGFTTDSAAEAYLRANRTPACHDVCGSLHIGALGRAASISRSDFCSQLRLDPARPIVCCTLRAKGFLPELSWVQGLWRRFQSIDLARRPQLVVRTNPMDRTDALDELGHLSGVALMRPSWEWLPEKDWCCPLPEDAANWAATIRHSALNVSAASTVTMEFAAFGRAVINPTIDPATKSLFESSFYSQARRNAWAESTTTLAELEDLVLHRLAQPLATVRAAPRLDAMSRAARLVAMVAGARSTFRTTAEATPGSFART